MYSSWSSNANESPILGSTLRRPRRFYLKTQAIPLYISFVVAFGLIVALWAPNEARSLDTRRWQEIVRDKRGVYASKRGRNAARPEGSISSTTLDDTVLMMSVNTGFADLTFNFLCHSIDRRIVDYQTPLFFSLDAKIHSVLQEVGLSSIDVREMGLTATTASQSDWGTATYNPIVEAKVQAVLAVLRLGYNAFFMDVDIILSADPVPDLIENVDWIFQPDWLLSDGPEWKAGLQPNSGFYLLRSNPRTIKFFERVVARFVGDYRPGNQIKFTEELAHSVETSQAAFVSNPRGYTPLHIPTYSDAMTFTNFPLVTYAPGCVVFGSSKEYLAAVAAAGAPDQPVALHHNCLFGHQGKVNRMKADKGNWNVDEELLARFLATFDDEGKRVEPPQPESNSTAIENEFPPDRRMYWDDFCTRD